MLRVSSIGIGNCGGQISDLAMVKHNIPGIAINSSQKDLINVKNIPRIVLGDEKGAGKNRDEAKRFIQSYIKTLLQEDKFINHIDSSDIIFVISSIGGGTGSGMAPMMIDILSRRFSEKKFILIEVYPPLAESLTAQQNGIDYLKEVREYLPNVVYMAYDNNRMTNMTTPEMMTSINNEIVEHMLMLRGEYLYPTPYNSIDEKDLLRILETPGRLAVFSIDNIKEKDFDNQTIEEAIIKVIKTTSSNVELDRDKVVKRLGIITNLNDKLTKLFDTNVPTIKEMIGEPIEMYEHCCVTDGDVTNRVILILSGLSVPDDRLEKIQQRIEEGLEELARVKDNSILDNMSGDVIKNLRQLDVEKAAEFDMDSDLDDIFNKFSK